MHEEYRGLELFQLGADDHRPKQIVPIPHPVIAFLANESTTHLDQKLFEDLVVERTESGHRTLQRYAEMGISMDLLS